MHKLAIITISRAGLSWVLQAAPEEPSQLQEGMGHHQNSVPPYHGPCMRSGAALAQ
jgi:hypothetical protein